MKTNRWVAAALGLVVALCCSVSMAATNTPPAQRGVVGLSVRPDEAGLIVSGVLEKSPAAQAGLSGGEQIVKIDGRNLQDLSIPDRMRLLAGAVGEKITLTLVRPGSGNAQPFEVTLVREAYANQTRFRPGKNFAAKTDWTKRPPTKEAGPVEWHGNKVVSRVLPYSDFVSLFVRLPIAHAAALGQGVKVAVVQTEEDHSAVTLVQNIAPRAEVASFTSNAKDEGLTSIREKLVSSKSRVVLVSDPGQWPQKVLLQLAGEVAAAKALLVVPSDLAEEPTAIESINKLQAAGALTVGRADRQSLILPGLENRQGFKAFNSRIRDIHTDVFSAAGLEGFEPPITAAATAAGVAALVLEKWPELSPAEIRTRLVQGARAVWQTQMTEGEGAQIPFTVDPVTTRFVPRDEKQLVRFRVLDAPGALEVDTEAPWFLNMLNCPKAWQITKGQGVTVLVTDQGFHLRHPALVPRIQTTRQFGPRTLEDKDQNFHGTDMSRILLQVAPEVRIVPVLCSGTSLAPNSDLLTNIAKSFRYAKEVKADVVTGSWAGWFNQNPELLDAVRTTVDGGVVVSWFHFPNPYPGLLRPIFTYAGGWEAGKRLGFADRFLTDPPGFHPVEIEAGLSGTAPQAAGLAALVKSVASALTPKEIEDILFQTATDIGGGILIPDAYQAVSAAKAKGR